MYVFLTSEYLLYEFPRGNQVDGLPRVLHTITEEIANVEKLLSEALCSTSYHGFLKYHYGRDCECAARAETPRVIFRAAQRSGFWSRKTAPLKRQFDMRCKRNPTPRRACVWLVCVGIGIAA